MSLKFNYDRLVFYYRSVIFSFKQKMEENSMNDHIQLNEGERKGNVKYQISDNVLALMTFTKAGTTIIIDHTEVDESLRGQGIGRQLLDRIVEMVRQRNMKIIPLCPYAKSVFEKDASIGDVLK